MTQIIEWSAARDSGLKRYYTGKLCSRGHDAERSVSSRTCCRCLQENVKGWQKQNVDRVKDWMDAARDRWISRNPGKKNLVSAAWKRRNRDKVTAFAAVRRARERSAMPHWADRAAIERVYLQARQMTEKTGIQHSVDHIVPLLGETVCGLHIDCNLQVLTLSDNSRKGRRIDWA